MVWYLRAWRLASGFTLQRAAASVGVVHTTLLRYEKSEIVPSDEMIGRLARLYGCSLPELAGPPEERKKGRRVHEAIELARSLPLEMVDRWLEIGKLLQRENGPETIRPEAKGMIATSNHMA